MALNCYEPQFTVLYNEELRHKPRAVLLPEGLSGYLKIQLTDTSGNAIDMSSATILTGPGTEQALQNPSGKIVLTEPFSRSKSYSTVATLDDNYLIIEIPSSVYKTPAIYRGQAELYEDSTLVLNNDFYLYVEPRTNISGPPRLAEIRMHIADTDPLVNELLGNYQFDLPEICLAAIETVQFWNDTPPPVAPATTENFAYKHIWHLGIQLFLFRMFEEFNRKNNLPYDAGGIRVDDRNKEMNYKRAWSERYQEFRLLVMGHKARINMYGGFTYLHSQYYGR